MTANKSRMGDVARLSGLSRSTVDRVLNDRPGVRSETVKRVEAAMAELGYAPSSLSARKVSARKRVAIVVSSGTNPFFNVIQQGFRIAQDRPEFAGAVFETLHYDPYAPDKLIAALSGIDPDVDAVVVLGIDRPDVAERINALVAQGIRVVTVISDTPASRRSVFVGQDNFAAGRTAARLMAGFVAPGPGKVVLMLGHLEFRHLLDRMAGFRQVMGLARPDLEIVQPSAYGADPAIARSVIAELSAIRDEVKGAYIAGGGQPILLQAFADHNLSHIALIGHEVSPTSRAALADGRFRALLAHDTADLAQRAIALALDPDAPVSGRCPIHIHVLDNLPD